MYVIKMCDDKSLLTTVKSTIFCGENNADVLKFLIPEKYGNKNIADCDVLMEYANADGLNTEPLIREEESYKGYLEYHLRLDNEFTKCPGKVRVSLEIADKDTEFLLKTDDIYIDILSESDEDIPQDKKYELERKVKDLEEGMAEIENKFENFWENQDSVITRIEFDSQIGNIDSALDTLLSIQRELWGEGV